MIDDSPAALATVLADPFERSTQNSQRVGQQRTVAGMVDVGLHRGRVRAQAVAPGNAKRSGPSDHLCVESLRPFGSQQSEEAGKHRVIRDRVFIKAGEAPIEEIGAQLLFEPAKRPAFEVLEHDRAQQTVGGDGGAPKIQGALAAARQGPRANGYQLRIIEQEINLAQGRVLELGEFLEESKPEQRSLALKSSDHYLIDILDYVTRTQA